MHGDEKRFYEKEETVIAAILEFLKTGQSYYPREIAAVIKFPQATTARALLTLVRDKQVRRHGRLGYMLYQSAEFAPEQSEFDLE